ncbi:16S rRNA (cytidine(1402)-2'-O)-methyltransferase [Buchnera aphidicola (Ceratovacuna keduensis)]|uniref:16S rRNA (cytidine(1402)-2'-O)-methyltransferase n=1 Tax=Buchnera aphidicola TaxID=9 RepID=UPI0031B88D59
MNKKYKNFGNLYIVSTPIGNIKDITYRSIEILKNVNIIAAENIKHTRKLLNVYKIKSNIISLNKNNENKKSKKIFSELLKKKDIAIVSNAGTPLINDPGNIIVKMCHKKDIKITPIPGACSAISAIVSSGIDSKSFCYEGFIPKKKKQIKKMCKKLSIEKRTIILFETSKRIIKSLKIMKKFFGKNRTITFSKEITKFWETIKKTKLEKLIKWLEFDKKRQKGEIVLIIKGQNNKKKKIKEKILKTFKILKKKLSTNLSIKITSKIHNLKKNFLYKYILKKKMT